MAPRSKPRMYYDSLAGIGDSSPNGECTCTSCECCVLSGRGLFDGPITRPEKSYRLSCVSMSVIDEPHTAMTKINMKLNPLLVERSTIGSCYWSITYIIAKSPSGFHVDTRPQKDGGQTRLPHEEGVQFSFHEQCQNYANFIFSLSHWNEWRSFILCGIIYKCLNLLWFVIPVILLRSWERGHNSRPKLRKPFINRCCLFSQNFHGPLF